ncbi:MAG: alpha/beta fold hydrolase [Sphingomonadales bacterium]
MRAIVAAFLVLMFTAAAQAADRWMTLPEPPSMPAADESGFARVNGIQMYYAVYGEGSPVLLIHGGLSHADVWANQVPKLVEAGHKVIVADSRGHGRSTRTAEPFGYDLMASDYVKLLDHLEIDRVALVGWSDGGIIGLAIAMTHPQRLTRLFAHAANVTTDGVLPNLDGHPVFGGFMQRMRADYDRLHDWSSRQRGETPAGSDYDAFMEQIGQMWASQPSWTAQQLAAIGVPAAIVIGDHDEAISRAHTEYMAKAIPGATLVILPQVSHFAMLQDPDGYTAAVLGVLDGK